MCELEQICEWIDNVWEDQLDDNDLSWLTQEHISKLITCEKVITENQGKRKFLSRGGHKHWAIDLHAEKDSEVCFMMHVRQSEVAPENFSIILRLNGRRKNVILYRCNGPHKEPDERDPLHTQPHSHTISVDDIRFKRFTGPNIKSAEKYVDIRSALSFFQKQCKIPGLQEYLPNEIGDLQQVSIEELNDDYGY